MTHPDGLDELSATLRSVGIKHDLFHDCIWITLPHDQGNVEIKAWSHQGRTAQLSVNREWFSLCDLEGEFDVAPEEVIALLTKKLAVRGLSLLQESSD